MRDHALYLRSLGIAVHLLHLNSKRPVGGDWSTAPVLTPEQLGQIDYTHYNLGIRPGSWSTLANGDHLGVIDFDLSPHCTEAERHDALRLLDWVLDGHDAYPTVISGSGGASRHYWASLPPEGFSTTVIGESERKVDTKHVWEVRLIFTGGNAVVPPSIHPDTGQPYRWEEGRAPWEVAIPRLADDALELLQASSRPTTAGDMPELLAPDAIPSLDTLRLPEDVRAFLVEGRYMPNRDGNASVQRAANQLYRLGLPDAAVLSVLQASLGGSEVAGKRRGDDAIAQADWLWKYACAKGQEFAPPAPAEVFEAVVPAAQPLPSFLQLSAPAQPAAQAELIPAQATPSIAAYEDLMGRAAMLGELDDPKPLLRDALHLGPIEMDKLQHLVAERCSVKLKAVEEQVKLLRPRGQASPDGKDFYQNWFYVAEQNVFFEPFKRMMLRTEAFSNLYAHKDDSPLNQALQFGDVEKVDRIDYAPGMPRIFEENGVSYVNGWHGTRDHGAQGDVERWLQHFDVLGWGGEDKKHVLQWMAFTLRHPERKINHILLLGGGEGNGKDFLLYPLQQAMAEDAQVIDADELLLDFNDYLLATKYLHVNEAEMGDRREARQVTNKLKRMAARPPETLRVNSKGVKPIKVRNLVSVSMTTNARIPLKLEGDARRYYALWTDVTVRGLDGQMTAEWQTYWEDRWTWMRDSHGWRACVWYLENCVDLSDFNAGAVPVLTDFVRDIQEDSESPTASLLRDMVQAATGVFSCDLLRPADIHLAVQANLSLRDMYGVRETPGTKTLTRELVQSRLAISLRAREGKGSSTSRTVLCLRNWEHYRGMSQGAIYEEYLRQIQQASSLSLVGGTDVDGK